MCAFDALTGGADLISDWIVGGARLIAVDGLGASGKSTLAALVADRVMGVDVIALDDFTRPGAVGWERERFAEQVVRPLRAGEPVRYQRHHWTQPEPGEWVELKPGRVLLVEGIGASEPAPEVVWDRVLWLAAPAAVRGKRALQRDPARHECWAGTWAPIEETWFAETRPWRSADAIWVNAA